MHAIDQSKLLIQKINNAENDMENQKNIVKKIRGILYTWKKETVKLYLSFQLQAI